MSRFLPTLDEGGFEICLPGLWKELLAEETPQRPHSEELDNESPQKQFLLCPEAISECIRGQLRCAVHDHYAAHQFRVVNRKLGCDEAAEGNANDVGWTEVERPNKFGDVAGKERNAVRTRPLVGFSIALAG